LILFGVFPFGEVLVKVDVVALVILKIPFGQDFVTREFIESGKDVLKSQDRAEQPDKILLRRLSDDRLPQRISRRDRGNKFNIPRLCFPPSS
jgi:hypothetical protein